jgi:hypothetical protein
MHNHCNNPRRVRQKVYVASATVLLALTACPFCQTADPSDANQIRKLIGGLTDHSVAVADALDPALEGPKRAKALQVFREPSYQLSLTVNGDMLIKDRSSASLPVKVHFKTPTREIEDESTAYFVKRAGVWYFSNFDFLAFPPFLIAVTVVCSLVGVTYAAAVLLLRNRLIRQGDFRAATRSKIFVPIFWPSLLRQTSQP